MDWIKLINSLFFSLYPLNLTAKLAEKCLNTFNEIIMIFIIYITKKLNIAISC